MVIHVANLHNNRGFSLAYPSWFDKLFNFVDLEKFSKHFEMRAVPTKYEGNSY